MREAGLLYIQHNAEGKALTQDAETHRRSEILSWFSSTFAGVQAHLNEEAGPHLYAV